MFKLDVFLEWKWARESSFWHFPRHLSLHDLIRRTRGRGSIPDRSRFFNPPNLVCVRLPVLHIYRFIFTFSLVCIILIWSSRTLLAFRNVIRLAKVKHIGHLQIFLKMDSLTHFHSRNVYFYIQFGYGFKITAFRIFQCFWVDTSLYIPIKT